MIRAGDALFRHGDYNHTCMVVDPMDFKDVANAASAKKMEIVHAASIDTAVYREVIDIDVEEAKVRQNGLRQYFTVFRPDDPELAGKAKDFACWWAWRREDRSIRSKSGPKLGLTKYSYTRQSASNPADGRYYGVQEYRAAGTCPALGFDGLLRAFKWACKLREAFSKNRGTTCCAYVTACYQAAVIDVLAKGDTRKVIKAHEFLKAARAAKLPMEERLQTVTLPKGTMVTKRSFAAYSNPGAKDSRSVDEYCQEASEIAFGKAMTVAEVFPPALRVDARFNYSDNLRKMMKAPGSGFTMLF